MNDGWIHGVWERKGVTGKLLWLLLLPASCIYRLIVQVRNALYSSGWIRQDTLGKPVISIGNLTVGGTGKTPSCLWLAQELRKRGFSVAILSRGYRRKDSKTVILQLKTNWPTASNREVDSAIAGDEPLMMARLYGQLVGVGKNRYQTGLELLSKEDVDVFLLDDGYQHRQLKRDVDLLLLGRHWAGPMLPAGPFREPRTSLHRADYYLITGASEKWQSLIPLDGKDRCFAGALKPVTLVGFGSNQKKEFPLTLLYRSKVLTVTGIADPSEFYRMIYDWEGEIVETLEFPDHYDYAASDWQQISRLSRHVDFVITTEKDILKLAHFPFAKDKLLALRVAMTVENGDSLIEAIVGRIRNHPDFGSPNG
jgi:tetraacyldisaccharide 4'-kinase